jgi:uncharacterized membrane protein YdbT with pleckstrin-like domain
MKFVKIGAVLLAVVVLGLEIGIYASAEVSWPMVLPPLLLLWPAVRALERRFTCITVSGDRLRYETGIASKSTRTIQLSKVQDVRVDQGLMQRMFNVGNLSIETAGETSRLSIANVDSPQALADELLNRAHQGSAV